MRFAILSLTAYSIFATVRWFGRYLDMLTLVYVMKEKQAVPSDTEIDRARRLAMANFGKHWRKKQDLDKR